GRGRGSAPRVVAWSLCAHRIPPGSPAPHWALVIGSSCALSVDALTGCGPFGQPCSRLCMLLLLLGCERNLNPHGDPQFSVSHDGSARRPLARLFFRYSLTRLTPH